MSCKTGCYETQIQACDDIKVKASLAPITAYYVIVSKPNKNRIYQRKLTTDVDGILTIPQDMFPAGYLTEANFLNIQLREGANYLTVKQFTFDAVLYDCVLAELRDFDLDLYDESPVNVIQ